MACNPSPYDSQWQAIAERFQFAGLATIVLGIIGGIAWFAPFDDLLDRAGTPLGGDFVMLYVAGQTVASGQAATLYDDQKNQARSNALFPQMDPSESWPYRYPPTVAACMAPLSLLPFTYAFVVFSLWQCMLLSVGIYFLRSTLPSIQSGSQWIWAIAGCPLILESLLGGQSSILAFAIAAGTIHLLSRHRDAAAGAVLALALYKPNVLFLFLVACIVARPKILLGFVPVAIGGLSIALGSGSWSGLTTYANLAIHLASTAWSFETPYWKVHGLAPFFQMLAPEHGKLICLLTGLTFSLVVAVAWRAAHLGDCAAWALLLTANSLFNPYVPIYDMTLLIVAFSIGCEASLRREFPQFGPSQLQWIAGCLFIGPHLSQAFCRFAGIQLFPLLLLGLMVALSACILWARTELAMSTIVLQR